MDDNKWEKLGQIGYQVKKTCQLCKHGSFQFRGNFGECTRHDYKHLKHTEAYRRLSIYRSGVCNDFEPGHEVDILHAYKKLITD